MAIGFENGINPISMDEFGRIIDTSTTTINGVIKHLTEEFLYKQNTLAGITEFKGQIYRVREFITNEMNDNDHLVFASRLSGDKVTVCKVRIPEIHAFLPIPTTYDSTFLDTKLINLYQDFVYEPIGEKQTFMPGDIVIVKFGNNNNFTDAKIVAKVGDYNGPPENPTKFDNLSNPDRLSALFA